MALACAVSLPIVPAAAAAATVRDEFRSAMLHELNRVRTQHRLPAVRGDRRLNGAALAHSRAMAQDGTIGHEPWSGRVMAAARQASSIGEVVGWLVQSDARGEAAAMVRDWLRSPPHRQLLLDAGFARVGIGRATGTMDDLPAALYTIDFASAR